MWRMRALFFQLIGIFLISQVSAYKVPDLTKVNWDIVFFLTPFGLLHNLMDSAAPIRAFYSRPGGQVALSGLQWAALALIFGAMVWNAYRFHQQRPKK